MVTFGETVTYVLDIAYVTLEARIKTKDIAWNSIVYDSNTLARLVQVAAKRGIIILPLQVQVNELLGHNRRGKGRVVSDSSWN